MAIEKRASLRRRVFRAGGWSVIGYGGAQAIRLVSNLIMTRLLVPEMFGVMAIATMVTVVIWMFSDIGLNHNIVQSQRGKDPEFLDTAWVVQIVRGFILWLMAIVVSIALYVGNRYALFPASSVYAMPVLPLVIVASSFSAVILGFQSTKIATTYRDMDQRQLVRNELLAQIAGLSVMISLGIATRSIWALVSGGLVANLVTMTLSHIFLKGHVNRFRCERGALRELIGFGKWVFVSSMVTVLASQGDRLLLGGLLDAQTLGLYVIAALLVAAFDGGLSKLFTAISLPALSETARENPSRLREVYYKLRVPGDMVLFFLAGLLFMVGQLIVDFLYDSRYAASGRMLEILALSLLSARYVIAYQIYLAMGVPRYMAIINFARCVSIYTLVPLLYYLAGSQAVLWGIAFHAMAMGPFIYFFNARLGLNDWRKELAVLPAFPIGLLCGWGIRSLAT